MLETVETIQPQTTATLNRGYVTFEEYLEQSSDTRICEWVDGEIINMPGASFEHQNINSFLITVLRLFVDRKDLGVVVVSPFAMKLESQRRGREPDILFVGKEKTHLIKKNYLDGAADLAIEIISPESVGRDRGEKFVEYEAAKIKEYWLIYPERRQVEFYRLNSDGFYQLAPTPEGVFQSEILPEFFLRVAWLWQEPLPTIAALKELNLI
ncbi:MAG: Uma2 family endonuclease [Acidobacteria bacterium]|jgi:Uma2 family endonuclease|nr:Uma2 family endonuclease [Acidobacteriota bacterium]